jgi:hypothetical protein
MTNLIVLTQFIRLAPINLHSKGTQFVNALTTHAETFANPTPALPVVSTSLAELYEAISKYQETGSKLDRLILQEKQGMVEGHLRQLACFSNMIANGDRAVAALTLMELRKIRTPLPPIDVVVTPKLSYTTTGKMKSRTKVVTSADFYKHCITDDLSLPVSLWKVFESTKATFVFINLIPGKVYHACVAACGKDEQCVYSDYATKMAV